MHTGALSLRPSEPPMATVYKALQLKEPGIMSMKIALAKLSAAAAGTAVIAGGALRVERVGLAQLLSN